MKRWKIKKSGEFGKKGKRKGRKGELPQIDRNEIQR